MSVDDTSFDRESQSFQAGMGAEACLVALAAAQKDNAELRDKYLRAAAANENARKQAERDAVQRMNQRLRNLFTRLLDVADNLERALVHSVDGSALLPGVQATLRQLLAVLRQEGVTPIDVEVGTTFDPMLHEAVTTQAGDADHATVAQVLQNGYMFDGQVLRPARVVVAVPSPAGP